MTIETAATKPDDLVLLNPNTRTWTVFRTAHAAALTRAIYQRVPVLCQQGPPAADPGAAYVPGPHMTEAKWFPGAALNFAENLLRPTEADDTPALVFRSELGDERTLTRRQLAAQAEAFAAFLRGRGVRAGDRVAAVVPNVPEAVVAMLGTTAIGAVWSSCSPDFGEDAICDRFGQI